MTCSLPGRDEHSNVEGEHLSSETFIHEINMLSGFWATYLHCHLRLVRWLPSRNETTTHYMSKRYARPDGEH